MIGDTKTFDELVEEGLVVGGDLEVIGEGYCTGPIERVEKLQDRSWNIHRSWTAQLVHAGDWEMLRGNDLRMSLCLNLHAETNTFTLVNGNWETRLEFGNTTLRIYPVGGRKLSRDDVFEY